jgi:K(+)-stimulated pyrophosphate-energized sodium pump
MTQTQSSLLTLVIGASAIALIFAVFLARWVLARPRGTPEMQKISNAIQQGAEAFLARQYKTIAALSLVVAVLLGVGYGFFRPTTAHDPVEDPKTFAL